MPGRDPPGDEGEMVCRVDWAGCCGTTNADRQPERGGTEYLHPAAGRLQALVSPRISFAYDAAIDDLFIQ
jgi:hypothetical protein